MLTLVAGVTGLGKQGSNMLLHATCTIIAANDIEIRVQGNMHEHEVSAHMCCLIIRITVVYFLGSV